MNTPWLRSGNFTLGVPSCLGLVVNVQIEVLTRAASRQSRSNVRLDLRFYLLSRLLWKFLDKPQQNLKLIMCGGAANLN